jgi:hypothetical protein
MTAFKLNRAKNEEDIQSGIYEKPHQIVTKTVMVNGKPQEFPVKVYVPTKAMEPPCIPVFVTTWTEGIKRRRSSD